MKPRMQLLLATVVVFLSLALVGIGIYDASAHRREDRKNAGQDPDRVVADKSRSDAPLKITLVKTKKRIVEDNQGIPDDDDWLRGLTLRVLNRSDKTVTYVGVQIVFRRTEDQESGLPAVWPFSYGFDPFTLRPEVGIPLPQVQPILAGADAEIRLSETEYNEVKGFLAEAGFPASQKRIELAVIKIGFSDGTAWNNGHLFRRDPGSVEGPLKGWSPLADPEGGKPVTWQTKGSAANRTAFFMNAAFKRDEVSRWQFSKLFRRSYRIAEDVPCGIAVYESVSCSTNPAVLDCHNDRSRFRRKCLAS